MRDYNGPKVRSSSFPVIFLCHNLPAPPLMTLMTDVMDDADDADTKKMLGMLCTAVLIDHAGVVAFKTIM